jgi:DNA polymerase-4
MILHIDMDAFYASIELRDNPSLVGKPVVVGGSAKGRGVIAAASYEARKYGLHSAMPASTALRRCPNAVFIKPRMQRYAMVSGQVREIFHRFTSVVEPLSLDEAFLDVTGCQRLFGDTVTIACSIRQEIKDQLGLTASAGIAPNKFLAKIASDLNKPDGLTYVDPNQIQEFLDPLEVSRVWGVGPKTAAKLAAVGVQNVGQLRGFDKQQLKTIFGNNADHFWQLSRGIDARSVVPDREAKSISHETTFPIDIVNDDALSAWLYELTDQVGRRLRRIQIRGRTVVVKIRDENFNTITRSKTLAQPSNSTDEFWRAVKELFSSVRRENAVPIRLLGMGVKELSGDKKVQRSLFDHNQTDKMKALEKTRDKIKDSFGDGALTSGASLEHSVRFQKRPRVKPDS